MLSNLEHQEKENPKPVKAPIQMQKGTVLNEPSFPGLSEAKKTTNDYIAKGLQNAEI